MTDAAKVLAVARPTLKLLNKNSLLTAEMVLRIEKAFGPRDMDITSCATASWPMTGAWASAGAGDQQRGGFRRRGRVGWRGRLRKVEGRSTLRRRGDRWAR